MTKLKVHILGNGNAAGKHRKAFAELPELYDVIGDYDAADVIDVCSPSHLHSEQSLMALSFEKHVFCEKPIAGSLRDVDALIDLQRKQNVSNNPRHLFPIFQYRFAPDCPKSREWDGSWRRRTEYYSNSSWRGKWETELGGVLTTQGIHALDHLVSGTATIKHVEAELRSTYKTDTETSASLTYRWSEQFGGGGRADGMSYLDFKISPDAKTTYMGDSHAGYVSQFKEIWRSITRRMEPPGGHIKTPFRRSFPPTLEDARKSIELLTACYYSAYTGEPVKLPILPSHPFYNGWQTAMKQWSQQHLQRTESSRKIPA